MLSLGEVQGTHGAANSWRPVRKSSNGAPGNMLWSLGPMMFRWNPLLLGWRPLFSP